MSLSRPARRAAPGRPASPMSTFPLGSRRVRRSGYGAMQLAGPWAVNAPPDRASAIGVLRAAVTAGIDHIDTAQYYGPDVVNDLIREALYPYPGELAIVSKVGVFRDAGAAIPRDDARQLRDGIEDNLRSLRVGQLAAVNLRLPSPGRAWRALRCSAGRHGPGPRRGPHRRCRPEQRQPRAAPARRGRHRDRLRAEPVPPRRPRLDPGPGGVHPPRHRLRAVLPARLAARRSQPGAHQPGGHPDSRPPWRHPAAGRPAVATAAAHPTCC